MSSNLRRKIVNVGVFPAATLVGRFLVALVVLRLDVGGSVQSQVRSLVQTSLDRVAQDVRLLCETQEAELVRRVGHSLVVARDVLARHGGLSLSKETVAWRARSQVDGAEKEVQLPRALVGGAWLGQNADPARPTAVVDEVQRLVGGVATIFQRMDGEGD